MLVIKCALYLAIFFVLVICFNRNYNKVIIEALLLYHNFDCFLRTRFDN
ncbi:hypothetical protein HMPREF9554_00062 [Treponema phagedenis F0421]|nr:hypothetical protein HMPREF9554_00062 [Treponema phagedenis F0421]